MRNLENTLKIASASIFCFYLKVHFVHLNVTGPNFYEYHKLTDGIWKDLIDSFDAISEQLRALDMIAPASLTEFKILSIIEDMTEVSDAHSMIYELLLDNDKILEILNEVDTMATNHIGLQNFIEGRADAHEKIGWMLRATIKE